jgi:hypothetical protein
LYLNPECLRIDPTHFRAGELPVVCWTYTLTEYGAQRFEQGAKYAAEDYRFAAVMATMLVASILALLVTLAALLAGQLPFLWQYLHWLAFTWLAAAIVVSLLANDLYRSPNPFPLVYQCGLRPDLTAPDPSALLLILEGGASGEVATPDEHAPRQVLGPLDQLRAFQIRQPEREDRHQRYSLIAHFDADAATPSHAALVATWRAGELEALKVRTSLHELHDRLEWVFFRTREDWLRAYRRQTTMT